MSWRAGSAPLLVIVLAGLGCSEDYSDEAFGSLQLDLWRPAGQANEVVERIDPQGGFESGDRAEFYDFGDVPTILSPETFQPVSAHVPRMYFFFTQSGLPLFAPPVREVRNGVDHLRGGQDVRDPNPKDFCVDGADPVGCAALNQAQSQRLYSLRYRDPWVDPQRQVADYQRPLVDLTPADTVGLRGLYTGLWEIVEVTVPDDYRPDAIKHMATLNRALKSGGFNARPTGKVINCPIIDERTQVPPGLTDPDTFRPRMEIWYRRKLAWCYLVNGWLTLGDRQGNRFNANADGARLQTFDVDQVVVGQGQTQQTVITVPVGRAFRPNVINFDDINGVLETPIAGQVVAGGRPRQSFADPPGYTPIRWIWDVRVTGEYVPDSITDQREIDEFQVRPTPLRRNLATRGIARRCSFPESRYAPGKCGNWDSTTSRIDASGDPECNALGLECNPDTCFCDVPAVKYGQRCGFGVARCASPDTQDSFWEHGYTCFPFDVGFCYLGCDPFGRNLYERQNEGRDPKDFVDSRCDGMSGYRCFFVGIGGICLRLCDENLNETVGAEQCTVVRNTVDSATMMSTMENIGRGQQCENLGVQVCLWPDEYAR